MTYNTDHIEVTTILQFICIKRLSVSMYILDVFRPPKLFDPGGQTFSHTGGGQTFYNVGCGGHEDNEDVDVDLEMYVSKVNFLVSEVNF